MAQRERNYNMQLQIIKHKRYKISSTMRPSRMSSSVCVLQNGFKNIDEYQLPMPDGT